MDLIKLFYLQTLRRCGTLQTQSFCDLWICNLWIFDPSFFAVLKRLQVHKYIHFLLTNIAYNALILICTILKKKHVKEAILVLF
jgi:hypothetical protein